MIHDGEATIDRLLGGFVGMLVIEFGTVPVYNAVQVLAINDVLWKLLSNNRDAMVAASRVGATRATGHDPGLTGPPDARPEGS